jgi:hypothetical protein
LTRKLSAGLCAFFVRRFIEYYPITRAEPPFERTFVTPMVEFRPNHLPILDHPGAR